MFESFVQNHATNILAFHEQRIAFCDKEVADWQRRADDAERFIYEGSDMYRAHYEGQLKQSRRVLASWIANRAGLELHKPIADNISVWCGECGEFRYNFPCISYSYIAVLIDEVM